MHLSIMFPQNLPLAGVHKSIIRQSLITNRSLREITGMLIELKKDVADLKAERRKYDGQQPSTSDRLDDLLPTLPLNADEDLATLESLLLDNKQACSLLVFTYLLPIAVYLYTFLFYYCFFFHI